jgi:hypothetical protein
MIGTEPAWVQTRQIQGLFGRRGGSRGTRRQVEQFIVHPNEIKSLQTGQAVMITKTPVAKATRLWVSPPNAAQRNASAQRRPPRTPSGPRRTCGTDQPDPGVTR